MLTLVLVLTKRVRHAAMIVDLEGLLAIAQSEWNAELGLGRKVLHDRISTLSGRWSSRTQYKRHNHI